MHGQPHCICMVMKAFSRQIRAESLHVSMLLYTAIISSCWPQQWFLTPDLVHIAEKQCGHVLHHSCYMGGLWHQLPQGLQIPNHLANLALHQVMTCRHMATREANDLDKDITMDYTCSYAKVLDTKDTVHTSAVFPCMQMTCGCYNRQLL